jgi:N-acetyl-gamma-glutamyl-phosphate reductase
MQVGIVGASGYGGAELLRLCAGHPELDVVVAGAATQAGAKVGSLYPSLAGTYPSLAFSEATAAELDGLDVVFLATPHGAAQALVPSLIDRVGTLLDLSADFRLRDPSAYPTWYGAPHEAPELLSRFVYGLPELFRPEIHGASNVAVPGCYPTAAALGLTPLVRAGAVVPTGIIVDAASGVSGAGRTLAQASHFATVDENFTAYGLLGHRHTPEMEQAIGAEVLFTPHLAPMTRGILATCYARPARPLTTQAVLDILEEAYAGEPFVVVSEAIPSTKATFGSNSAHLTARVDPRSGWVMVLSAIDNLGKGAAGQAIQCANLIYGLPETTGLSIAGVYP